MLARFCNIPMQSLRFNSVFSARASAIADLDILLTAAFATLMVFIAGAMVANWEDNAAEQKKLQVSVVLAAIPIHYAMPGMTFF